MKFKILLTLATTLAFGFTVIAADDDTPLAKEMSAMNKSLRTVKRQAADAAKKDDNLALVAKMKTNAENAKKLEPKKTKDVPAAEKAAYLKKYNDQIDEMIKTLGDLEKALAAGNQDDVKKAFEKLSDGKEKGHKDFGADED